MRTIVRACLKAPIRFSHQPLLSPPGATLTGVTPTLIGLFPNPAPGCGAPIQALVDGIGIGGAKAASIQLTNITGAGTTFSGNLSIDLQSTKEVLGPSHLPISIPVSVAATTAGANVTFGSCSTNAALPAAGNATTKTCVANVNKFWTVAFTNSECAPLACTGAETSFNLGCQGMGNRSYWTNVTCSRLCYVAPLASGYDYSTFCPFGQAGNGPFTAPLCNPPTCAVGSTSLNVNCTTTNIGSGAIGGYCERFCRVN
jgi:hypothetical protein